ncbi:hypothetical protein ACHAXS_008053 [Conticribra weissflogii]
MIELCKDNYTGTAEYKSTDRSRNFSLCYIEPPLSDHAQATILEKEAKLAASNLLQPFTSDELDLVQNALYTIGSKDDVIASFHGDSIH